MIQLMTAKYVGNAVIAGANSLSSSAHLLVDEFRQTKELIELSLIANLYYL